MVTAILIFASLYLIFISAWGPAARRTPGHSCSTRQLHTQLLVHQVGRRSYYVQFALELIVSMSDSHPIGCMSAAKNYNWPSVLWRQALIDQRRAAVQWLTAEGVSTDLDCIGVGEQVRCGRTMEGVMRVRSPAITSRSRSDAIIRWTALDLFAGHSLKPNVPIGAECLTVWLIRDVIILMTVNGVVLKTVSNNMQILRGLLLYSYER